MTINAELTQTDERNCLTALVKTLVANHRLDSLADAEFRPYEENSSFPPFGIVKLKDSVLVFSNDGAYTDIESAVSLLTSFSIQPNS